MGFGLSDVFGIVANPGQFYGTNNLIGGAINDVTGATNSSKQQYKNQLKLQKDAQEFAKWQMNNAHQTEVADLEAAGLNPVLSANGGASAGVSMGGASTGTPAGDPINMISAIVGMMNNTKATKALVDKTDAETQNINADTNVKKQTIEWTPALNKALIKMQNATSGKQQTSAQKDFQDIIESQVRTKGLEIMNKMSGMDLTKREKFFNDEMEILKQQMTAEFIELGYQNDTIYRAIDKAFSMFGKLANFGVNVGYSHSNSNVNVKHNPGVMTHSPIHLDVPQMYR